MASENRIAGSITFQIDGEIQNAAGDFTYNTGAGKRTGMVGPDRGHGFKEEPQIAFIEGSIRDRRSLDLSRLVTLDDVTVTLSLANGKVIVAQHAWYAGEGTGNTADAVIPVRFEAITVEEIK